MAVYVSGHKESKEGDSACFVLTLDEAFKELSNYQKRTNTRFRATKRENQDFGTSDVIPLHYHIYSKDMEFWNGQKGFFHDHHPFIVVGEMKYQCQFIANKGSQESNSSQPNTGNSNCDTSIKCSACVIFTDVIKFVDYKVSENRKEVLRQLVQDLKNNKDVNVNRRIYLHFPAETDHVHLPNTENEECHFGDPHFPLADRFGKEKGSLWLLLGRLRDQYKCVDLGTGFPETCAPLCMKEELARTQQEEDWRINQYSNLMGHPRLRNAIKEMYGPLLGRELDPDDEILVTVGASQGLFCAIGSMLNPGDEVIMFEPFFSFYRGPIETFHGKMVTVPLRTRPGATSSADLYFDEHELEDAFSPRTKAVLINTPHNPTGKVFTRTELEMIAEKIKRHNCLCLSDEVYECSVYDDNEHIRIATFPGMWERTLSLYSGGKCFGVTGWKVGWVIGPKAIIKNVTVPHAKSIMSFATPLQVAFAAGLEHEIKYSGTDQSYLRCFNRKLQKARDELVEAFQECGLQVLKPGGSYFFLVDNTGVDFPRSENNELRDMAFVKWLLTEKGVFIHPISWFYLKTGETFEARYNRVCFAKREEAIQQAKELLKAIEVKKYEK